MSCSTKNKQLNCVGRRHWYQLFFYRESLETECLSSGKEAGTSRLHLECNSLCMNFAHSFLVPAVEVVWELFPLYPSNGILLKLPESFISVNYFSAWKSERIPPWLRSGSEKVPIATGMAAWNLMNHILNVTF